MAGDRGILIGVTEPDDQAVLLTGFPARYAAVAADPPRFPIVVPLGEIGKWYGGVRNWKIATDATVTSTTTMGSFTVPSGNLEDQFSRSSELELFQPGTFMAFSTPTVANVTLSLFAGNPDPDLGLPSPCIALVAGAYKPAIEIFGAMNKDDAVVEISSRLGHFAHPSGSFTAHVKGQAVTVYYLKDTSSTDFSCTQMEFEPADDGTGYWPWAAKDGSPIWDTTTGAKLQDSLN